MEQVKTTTEESAKTLYQILSERELDRIKGGNIPDTPLSEVTIGSLMHIALCLDDGTNLSTEATLSILIKRGGL